MLSLRVNFLGILSSLIMLYLALYPEPWWVIVGGVKGETLRVMISPFMLRAIVLSKPVIIPLVTYLNISSRAYIVVIAILVLIGSFISSRRLSRHLFSFGPLVLGLTFILTAYFGLSLLKIKTGIDIPIMGGGEVVYNLTFGETVVRTKTPVHAEITNSYWIFLTDSMMLVIAKYLQIKIIARQAREPSK